MNKEYFEWRFELSKKNIALTGFLKIKTKQGLKGTLPVPETKEVILLMKTSTNLIFLPVNETKTPLQFFTFSQKTTSQFRYADSSPTGQFPDWHFPEANSPTDTSSTETSPTDISPNGQFPDRTLPQRTLPRLDISPLRHFPERTFPWPHVLVRFFFQIIFLFVCSRIY